MERAEACLKKLGHDSPDSAADEMQNLPDRILHCADDDGPIRKSTLQAQDDEDCLRCAIILGRCSGSLYDPDKPVIWTQDRLNRRLRLYHSGSFYDED